MDGLPRPELTAAIGSGDVEATLALLRSIPQETRAGLRSFARDVAARFPSSLEKETSTWEGRPRTPDADASIHVRRRRAAVCVVVAAGTEVDILGCTDQTAVFVRALSELRPACADALAERLIDGGATGRHPLARALVAAGVSRRPTSEAYVLGFLTRDFQGGLDRDWKRGLRSALLDDPAHLVADVEQLLATEGTSDLSLASYDKYAGGAGAEEEARVPLRFATAILGLVADGTLERGRVLHLTLAALSREWPAFRSGWFSRLHDALRPSVEEIARREATYVALLASTIPATVAMAIEALHELHASSVGAAMDHGALVDALAPVMAARAKGTALGGLRLLARAIAAEPGLAVRGSRVVALALAHGASDVQRGALDLLDTHGAPDDHALRALCGEARRSGGRLAARAGPPVGAARPAHHRCLDRFGDGDPPGGERRRPPRPLLVGRSRPRRSCPSTIRRSWWCACPRSSRPARTSWKSSGCWTAWPVSPVTRASPRRWGPCGSERRRRPRATAGTGPFASRSLAWCLP